MSCEVMRVLQLGKSSINHISYEAIRKDKTKFIPELFPDAYANVSSVTADEWFSGVTKERDRISLKPQPKEHQTVQSIPLPLDPSFEDVVISPIKILSDENLSKYKFIGSQTLQKRLTHDLPDCIELKSNAESNGMSLHYDTIAVPLVGTAGRVGIFKLSKPGRIELEQLNFVEHGSNVLDFEIDPKDDNLLAVLCDNSSLNIWKIPPNGLDTNLKTPNERIKTGQDRPTILKFHPCASSIIATSGVNGTVSVWDVEKAKNINVCEDINRCQSLSLAWNDIGSNIACVSIDHVVRIFNPRVSKTSVLQTDGFPGSGPSRVTYIDDNRIFLSGFTNDGVRIIGTKDTRKAQDFLTKLKFDSSPGVFNPFYDPDINVVFLCAKVSFYFYILF
ncbi:Coronin-7 [Thelohanellus kitauei]|uniref:Coronin-7 n=1 Tax=Thelohanellus kitauei TaxID=669202 RepID=A0A0C2MKE1_THEKT|nr:Coronin-7 [Thelohanellus kitauei]